MKHSLIIQPPEFMQITESMSFSISNSSKAFTHAFFLYFTSYSASFLFSASLIPECAKVILFKFTN